MFHTNSCSTTVLRVLKLDGVILCVFRVSFMKEDCLVFAFMMNVVAQQIWSEDVQCCLPRFLCFTRLAVLITFSVLLYQALGRTPLSEVSPKKTLEGAACGLSASVAVSVVLGLLFQWPMSSSRYEYVPKLFSRIIYSQ